MGEADRPLLVEKAAALDEMMQWKGAGLFSILIGVGTFVWAIEPEILAVLRSFAKDAPFAAFTTGSFVAVGIGLILIDEYWPGDSRD